MGDKGTYTLVVEDRFGAFTDEYSFDSGELIIGRSRQSDIVLSSENVSRRHARIWTTPNGLMIEDLHSANGTFVNGKRVIEPTELSDKDVIRLGDYHLHVHGGRPASDDKPVYVRFVGLNLTVADQVFEVTSPTTLVGRGKDCGLVLVDPSISRMHARIIARPDSTVLVEDMGSANGVSVNGKRVKVWQLSSGDKVRFGNVEFLVEIPSASTQETSTRGIRDAFDRIGRNLPWIVAVVCVVVVLVLLVIFVPSYLKKESPVPETPEVTMSEPEPAKAPVDNTAELLATARKALSEGDIEDAAQAVATVLKNDPVNAEAIRLTYRIENEREASKALKDADQAVAGKRYEEAVISLLKVPKDSVYFEQAKGWMIRLLPELQRMRKKACASGKTVDCVRFKAHIGKMEKTISD